MKEFLKKKSNQALPEVDGSSNKRYFPTSRSVKNATYRTTYLQSSQKTNPIFNSSRVFARKDRGMEEEQPNNKMIHLRTKSLRSDSKDFQ